MVGAYNRIMSAVMDNQHLPVSTANLCELNKGAAGSDVRARLDRVRGMRPFAYESE